MAIFTIPSQVDLKGARDDLKQFERIAKASGEKTATELLKAMKRELDRQRADIQEAQRRGLITSQEARKLGNDVARAFNEQIVARLDQMRRAGQQNTAEFQKLQRSLRAIAKERPPDQQWLSFGAVLKRVGTVAAGVVAALGITGGLRSGIAFLRDSIGAAEELAKSYLRLQSSAKLFGVSQKDLTNLAARARSEFALNAGAANELAVQVTKLAARAGDASKAQDLLTRALDLGAAQGHDAATVALALEQSLRGVDEGTDRLLQRNPSQIYKEWAAEIGKAAGQLTDAEQKQAIMNAILREGEKVQGAYGAMLDTNVGQMTRWRQRVQEAREEIGQRALPLLVQLQAFLAGPFATAVTLIADAFERWADPMDRIIARMERLGVASETVAPLILKDAIEDSEKSLEDLNAEFKEFQNQVERRGREQLLPEIPGLDTLPKDRGELQRLIRQAEADVSRERAADDRKAIEAAQTRLEFLRKALGTVEKIAAEEESIRRAQAALPEAERKAALRAELTEIEGQLTALAERGDSAAAEAVRRTLEARAEEIRKALGQAVDAAVQAAGGGGTGDDAAAKAAKAARERIDKQLALFTQQQEFTQTAGVSGFTDETLRRFEQIVRLMEQIDQLEEDIALLGGAAPAGARDLLAQKQAELAKLQAASKEAAEDVRAALERAASIAPEIADITVRSLRPIRLEYSNATKAVGDLERAERDLLTARATGDPDRIAAAEERVKVAREAGREAVRELAIALADGKLSTEEAEKAAELLKKHFGDLVGETDQWARGIELAVRGALNVLEVFGSISDQVRDVGAGVLDIVAGFQQIQDAKGSLLGVLGGAGAALGGALAIGSALFGGDDREKARQEALQRELDAINDATEGLKDFGREIGAITQQVRRAQGLLDQAARAAGLEPGTAQSLVQQREDARAGLAAARAGTSGLTGAALDKLIADLEKKFEALNGALEAYDAAMEEIRQGVLRDLELSRAQATLSGRELEQRELELAQLARRADLEAAGLITDAEVLASLEATEAAEKAALEARIAEAEAANILNASLRKLASEGFAETARINELLANQEKRLAELRKEGASAAEIAAEEEAQQAEREAEGRTLGDRIRRRAAERSGDTETLLRLDQADLERQFMDEMAALKALADAGAITAEEFEELSALLKGDLGAALEDLAEAAAEAAAAQKEAAEDFEGSLELDLARAEGRDADARRIEAEDRRDARRRRAEELGILDDVTDIIERLFQIESTGGTGPTAVTAQEPTESVAVRQSMTQTEQTAQTGLGLDRTRNALLRAILAEMRGGVTGISTNVASVNPTAFLPPVSRGAGATVVNLNLGDLSATVQLGAGATPEEIADAALGSLRPGLVRTLVREVDTGQAREHINFRRSQGIIRRP